MPITPVPPVTFCTLMFTPKYFLPFFTRVRASVSVPPPAAHGTINVMSRSGNAAFAGAGTSKRHGKQSHHQETDLPHDCLLSICSISGPTPDTLTKPTPGIYFDTAGSKFTHSDLHIVLES